MKKDSKNIEHIFKEGLQDIGVTPPEHLWANISQEITPKRDSKKYLLFWFTGTGIAASLLLFSVLLFDFSMEPNNNTIIVTTENEYCPEESLVNSDKLSKSESSDNINNNINLKTPLNSNTITYFKNQPSLKESLSNSIKKTNEQYSNTQKLNNSSYNYASAEEIKETSDQKEKALATLNKTVNTPLVKKQLINIDQVDESDFTSLLNETNDNEVKKERIKRWSIQPQIGTFAYNSSGNGSSINSDFKNNPQDTETDLSYGMRLAYQATPNITIRTGISNATINIITSNIGVDTSSQNSISELFSNNDVAIVNLYNPNSNSPGQDSVVSDVESPVIEEFSDQDTESESPTNSVTSGKISQQIQYVEIPIEVAYKILDKKIGLNIIGGFSTFILSKNETTFENVNDSTSLGETASINNTSHSSNIGFSIDYRLIDNLKFSIEPMLKFQFNSFDSSTEYQPYFIGVSSGLKWNF